MLLHLKDALSHSDAVAAHVAVGGKPPRECVIVAADEIGVVLRWLAFPETYLLPWNRIEAILLKAA